MFKVHGVLGNKDLPSTLKKQTEPIALAYNIFGTSWNTLTNNLKEELLTSGVGIC